MAHKLGVRRPALRACFVGMLAGLLPEACKHLHERPAVVSPAPSAARPAARSEDSVPHRAPVTEEHAFFRIEVVAQASGEPLGGAVLRTVNDIVLQSDARGVVAFYEPGLMDENVFFEVHYPGYQLPKDAYGYRGAQVHVVEGGSVVIGLAPIACAFAPAVDSVLQSQLAAGPVPGPEDCLAIRVVDLATGRGLPLVEMTAGGRAFWTDSDGRIAVCPAALVDGLGWARLRSHGYAPRTVRLGQRTAGEQRFALERINVAERLYRVTGEGIYRDSVLLGKDVPLRRPVLNGDVVGQDSVQATPYRGKVFWVWGDTQRPAHPLGNFHATAARSDLPHAGGLAPEVGVDLDYLVGEDGFVRPVAPKATVPGQGVTWLGSLVPLPDRNGQTRLFASYALVPEKLTAGEIGVVRYDDVHARFVKVLKFPSVDSRGPSGHPTRFLHKDGAYVYFQPPLRIPAQAEAIVDPLRYETFTARVVGSERALARTADGSLDYRWKTGTGYVTRELLAAASIGSDQALFGHLRDPQSGETVIAHEGSSRTWNPYRERFVELITQVGGRSSFLGELWYAEGDTPMGPWVYARKIVSHDDYTFYNPRQHPFFDQRGGRTIYFEGTYDTTFASSNAAPTPRYNYNQIMYRLDLQDPRLALPVPVYDLSDLDSTRRAAAGPPLVTKAGLTPGVGAVRPAFFALDRPADGFVAVSWSGAACAQPRLVTTPAGSASPTPPLFYALPAATPASHLPKGAVPLYEYTAPSGAVAYAAQPWVPPGLTRSGVPLCYVWSTPIRVRLPVADYLGDLVAVAGGDLCLPEPRPGAPAAVQLDGSRSQSRSLPIARALWSAETRQGRIQAQGLRATLKLPRGTHVVELDVWDRSGARDRDVVVVEVYSQSRRLKYHKRERVDTPQTAQKP